MTRNDHLKKGATKRTTAITIRCEERQKYALIIRCNELGMSQADYVLGLTAWAIDSGIDPRTINRKKE